MQLVLRRDDLPPEGLIIRVFRMRFGPDRNVRFERGLTAPPVLVSPDVARSCIVKAEPPTLRVEPLISAALAAWSEGRITFGDREHNARKQANRLRRACDAEGWTEIQHITREGLVAHFNALAAGLESSKADKATREPVTPKTIETLLAQFRSFLAWCVDSGLIQFNAAATIRGGKRSKKRGPQTRSGMRALYEDEPLRLIAAAEADERSQTPRFSKPRSFVYKLALMTGGRKGQLTLEPGASPIRWRDVCIEGNDPHVMFCEAKNGDNWKVPLCAAAVETLREWRIRCELAGPDDFVFPFRVQDRVIIADLAGAGIAKLGGPHNRPANFHSLRKTFCTNLVLSGVPVPVAQQLMQHKTLEMTLKVYTEVRDEQLTAGVRAVQNFFEVGKSAFQAGLRAIGSEKDTPLHDLRLTKGGRFDDTMGVRLSIPNAVELSKPCGLPAAESHKPCGRRAASTVPDVASGEFPRRSCVAEVPRGGLEPPLAHTPQLHAGAVGGLADVLEHAAGLLSATARAMRGAAARGE